MSKATDIIKRIDQYTGEDANYKEVTVWSDGSLMTDIKCDGVVYIKLGNIYYKRQFTNQVNIMWWGVKSSNEDNVDQIQKCFDYCDGKGLEIIIPDDNGDFLVSDTLKVGSKTTLTFLGSFIKLSTYTSIGTVLMNKENSSNIIINNPLIDGSNITAGGTGDNGISFFKCKKSRVYGGIIKNCKKGTEAFKLGGKAFQVEDVDVEDCIIDGASINNCSWALSSQYNISLNESLGGTKVEVKFNNIYATNCENLAILHQQNGLVDSDNHIVEINNLISINCGNSDGLMIVSRLKNAKINGIYIKGDSITGDLIRGRHSFCSFKNIKVEQEVDSLVSLIPSFHGESTDLAQFNVYDFDLNSEITSILKSSTDDTYSFRELRDSHIKVVSSKSNFDFTVPQAAYISTNVEVITHEKHVLINSTEAILGDLNEVSKFQQVFNLGSGRKIKSGILEPNTNIIGTVGDLYLKESVGYTNIYFKFFGTNTNTGWSKMMPFIKGSTEDRQGVELGVPYFDTTLGKPIWFNGSTWIDASGTPV